MNQYTDEQHFDEGELHRKIHALSTDIDGRIKAGDIIVDQISDLRAAVNMVLESASFHGYPYLPPPQRLMVMLEKVIRGEIKMEDYYTGLRESK